MASLMSLNDIIQEPYKNRCDKCIVKQMIEYGDCCYWPSKKDKWDYFLPEVEISQCYYLDKVLKGASIKPEDDMFIDKCDQFIPQIEWNGLRKTEIKIIQAIFDFCFLSTGKKADFAALIEIFQEVKRMKNIRIQTNVSEIETVMEQFAFERQNYALFGVVRDAVAEISDTIVE